MVAGKFIPLQGSLCIQNVLLILLETKGLGRSGNKGGHLTVYYTSVMCMDAACRHSELRLCAPDCTDNKVGLYAIERLTLLVGSNYSPTADSFGTYSG